MGYSLDLALDQWRQGQLRIMGDPALMDAAEAVLAELRKRLGGGFEIGELADLYGQDNDWAYEVAGRHSSGTDSSYAVDAAFARYARQASDFAGGRMRRVGDEGDGD
ncbi:MAG: hypothetical protein WD993_05265 [Thermoleophilaceae bacterium]